MARELERCVDFLQRLIRTRSLSGEEGAIAELVREEMESLGYDFVEVDEAGNVLGRVAGLGEAPPLLFNTHLDHVDVGDPASWPHPPYGGELVDGVVWGRGAVDIKGPLAAQVHGVARLVGGEPPPGDVWVTCVVQEEIGGVGARHLASGIDAPIAVIGEPSGNTVRRGHRGRTELVLHLAGRSVHASVPERGVNPLYPLGRFLTALANLEHPTDPDLGPSTVTPTLLGTDQSSANVVPGEVWLTLDWRNVPGQDAEQIRDLLQRLADACCSEALSAEVTVPAFRRTAYTGLEMTIPASNPAYALPADHPAVRAAAAIVDSELGGARPVDVWRFATDGGHFADAGVAPVGFGPGDELLAHTVDERIEVAALEQALRVNARFARELSAAGAR